MSVEVQTAVIGAIAAVAVAGFGLLGEIMRRNLKTIQGHTAASREQVQNSHSTNLRDDIDRVLSSQDVILREVQMHGRELEGLREDIRQERTERVAGDKATVAALTVVANQH